MQQTNSKIIHILGASLNQVELIKTAQRLGYKVLVSDMYENPPGKEFADFFEQADTTDLDGTFEIAKKYNIAAICTDQTDVAVTTVAYIAEKLNLKGIGYDVALRFTNKNLMRSFLSEYLSDDYKGNIPGFKFFSNAQDAFKSVSELFDKFTNHALIVKPINSQGSKGVAKLVKGEADSLLQEKINIAMSESHGSGILIESFIAGYEVAVESFVEDGEIYPLCISKKDHYQANPCLDQRVEFLGDISVDLEKKLFALNSEVIKTLGQSFGLNHSEYMIANGKPYLMETAARGAGSNVSGKIVPFLTRFNTNEALINSLFNIPNNINIANYRERFAVLEFFNLNSAKTVTIKAIDIDPELYKLSEELRLNVNLGDSIDGVADSRARVGQLILFSEIGADDLRAKNKRASELIKIAYE